MYFLPCTYLHTMAEAMGDKKVFSLLEVTRSVQKTIHERYTSAFWVRAEMNKLNHYLRSGHAYPELVEKVNGRVVAQMRSTLWSAEFQRINRRFMEVLKEPLKDGIKILFLAKIDFDPEHGLSLQILDIDPSYTLGDLEQEKQETIRKLKEEKLFDKNREHRLAILPQRLAIISVETSKGYADFMEVIGKNPYGYAFFTMLFPAVLQGEAAIRSIQMQLERIRRVSHHFDAVAIIRGGGGDIGLSCYNNYQLSRAVADFPLPVLTGIGHATNETVCEMVSFQNAITPTKLAEFLLLRFHEFAVPVNEAAERISELCKVSLEHAGEYLRQEARIFRSLAIKNSVQQSEALHSAASRLNQQTRFVFREEAAALMNEVRNIRRNASHLVVQRNMQVDHSALNLVRGTGRLLTERQQKIREMLLHVQHLDPVNVLKRGYSITWNNGKALRDVEDISEGDHVETELYKGKLTSRVESKTKKEDE